MAFDKSKCDKELGQKVHNHLKKLGIHTPIIDENLLIDNKEKIKKIQSHMTDIMTILGLDLSDDSLIETPNRVAKMWVNETLWGLYPENFPKITTVENKMRYDEMVVEKNITVMSECEHHILPIDGVATVAYIPKDKVLGLSKINRIVEYFSRRPQIQERLAEQIYHTLSFILGTDDVAVVIDAVHYCVRSRGVEDSSSRTTTSKLGGVFKDRNEPARAEFFSIVNSKKE